MPASGSTDLPLGTRDEVWDADKASASLDPADISKAFFWVDPTKDATNVSSYKLGFAEDLNGDGTGVKQLHAVWAGVTAAAGAIQGARGGVDIPDADVADVKAKIAVYYALAAKTFDDDSIQVPWESKSTAAHGEQRVLSGQITNLRVAGQDVSGDGSFIVSGYAAVYEQEATLFSSPSFTEREIISRGAFDSALAHDPLVHLNIGHDMKQVMASTAVKSGPGSLQLHSDPNGLHFEARVSPNVSYARDAAELMKLGVVNQASFAFTIGDQEMDQNVETSDGAPNVRWRINSIRQLYDVCVTPQGAYPQTSSTVRSLWGAAFGRSEESEGHPGRSPIREGSIQVTEETPGPMVTDTQEQDQTARRARERERGRLRLLKEQT